jgi:hypothetical protein
LIPPIWHNNNKNNNNSSPYNRPPTA